MRCTLDSVACEKSWAGLVGETEVVEIVDTVIRDL